MTRPADGKHGHALVPTMLILARPVKLNAVAQGIETEQQCRLLRTSHCADREIYLLGKAVPADILETRNLAQPALSHEIPAAIANPGVA